MADPLETIRDDLYELSKKLNPDTVDCVRDILESIDAYLAGYREHQERQERLDKRLKDIKEKMNETTNSSTT